MPPLIFGSPGEEQSIIMKGDPNMTWAQRYRSWDRGVQKGAEGDRLRSQATAELMRR